MRQRVGPSRWPRSRATGVGHASFVGSPSTNTALADGGHEEDRPGMTAQNRQDVAIAAGAAVIHGSSTERSSSMTSRAWPTSSAPTKRCPDFSSHVICASNASSGSVKIAPDRSRLPIFRVEHGDTSDRAREVVARPPRTARQTRPAALRPPRSPRPARTSPRSRHERTRRQRNESAAAA